MIQDRACALIRKAERGIRELIGEAAVAGNYELVSRLSAAAKQFALLESGLTHTSDTSESPSTPTGQVAKVARDLREKSPSRRRPSKKQGYPLFERSRGALVKVGWSKKDRSEYLHKVSRAGLDAVVARLLGLGVGERVFTTEELLPVKAEDTGDEVPSYQVYVCLAWLREIGVIKQHGRSGYSVSGTDPAGTVTKNWETLPTFRR